MSTWPAARLVIYKHWGVPDPPGYARNILAAKEWRAARMTRAVSNLKRLRGLDYDDKGREISTASGKDTAALCLAYKNEFPASLNALPGSGATPGFVVAPKPFASGTPGLVFTDGTPGIVANLPGPMLIENGHHSIQFYLHRPPVEELKAQGKLPVWGIRWGANTDTVYSYWQFQITDGRAEIMRLLPGWTQTLEDSLNELLALEDPTVEQQNEATALGKQIHADVNRINVGNGGIYNQDIELAFLAESRGIIDIAELDQDIEAVEIPSILQKRTSDIIWSASQLQLYSNIGIFAHQWGRPAFQKEGSIRLGTYISDADFASGDATFGGIWDAPDGTTVAIVNESSNPSDPNYNPALVQATPHYLFADQTYAEAQTDVYETVIKLTGDGTNTPFLYAAYLYLEAGERTGSDEVVWDSDDHPGCIKEISPQLEGGSLGSISRRSRYTVTIRAFNDDRDLAAFGTNANLLADAYRFENHVCDLFANGQQRVGKGIVLGSTFTNARSGERAEGTTDDSTTMFAQDALWPWTDLELDISDKWALADEDMFIGDEPLGDGQYLGRHLRSGLRGMGERYSEIGFTDTDGGLIRPASLGEKFAALPETYEVRSDYLLGAVRDHSETGLQMGVDNTGTWQLTPPQTEFKRDANGDLINFSSGERNNPYDVAGKYAILKKFEMTRDFSKVYNFFTAIGASMSQKRRTNRSGNFQVPAAARCAQPAVLPASRSCESGASACACRLRLV